MLASQDAEKYLSRLVTQGTVFAKIDRPQRVVVFKPRPKPTEVLNDWGSGLRSVYAWPGDGVEGWGGVCESERERERQNTHTHTHIDTHSGL